MLDPELFEGLTPGARLILLTLLICLPTLGIILVAGVNSLSTRIKKVDEKADQITTHTEATQFQVVNDHGDVNLRDDMDELKSDNVAVIKELQLMRASVNKLGEFLGEHMMTSQKSMVSHDQRLTQVVGRLNEMSSRVRRVEETVKKHRPEE